MNPRDASRDGIALLRSSRTGRLDGRKSYVVGRMNSVQSVQAVVVGPWKIGVLWWHTPCRMPCMTDLRTLVEELPECEPKGRLRGLATAAHLVEDRYRGEILARMAAVVREWRDQGPVADLGRELERQIRGSRAD